MIMLNFILIFIKDLFYEKNIILFERFKVIKIILIVEVCYIVWFMFEFFVCFVVFLEKWNFFFWLLNVIDLIVIVLFYILLFIFFLFFGILLYILCVFCLFRVFWVMKFFWYILIMKVFGKIVRVSISDLWMMCFFNLFGIVLFGSMVYYCESWDEEIEFESILMVCWWVIVIIIIVGYGDLVLRIFCKLI